MEKNWGDTPSATLTFMIPTTRKKIKHSVKYKLKSGEHCDLSVFSFNVNIQKITVHVTK